MKVELLPCDGKNLATGSNEVFKQYRVVVDDTLVGYKSWDFGSSICFIGRVSPVDKSLIEEEVSAMLGDSSSGVMPPEFDPDDLPEEDYKDDFPDETVTA